jgi:hypothetical protein
MAFWRGGLSWFLTRMTIDKVRSTALHRNSPNIQGFHTRQPTKLSCGSTWDTGFSTVLHLSWVHLVCPRSGKTIL